MKKFLLSLGVIATMLVYGWHQRNEAEKVAVTPPSSISPQPKAGRPLDETVTSSPAVLPTSNVITPTPTPKPIGQYKDGQYTGSAADAFYGNIQVQAVIQNGKITDVLFLQYPNDRGTSIEINSQAMPYLKQEAIAAQSANVDIISGATDSSMAFRQSLDSALSQARI